MEDLQIKSEGIPHKQNDHKNNNMFSTLVETALITDIDQGQTLLLKTKTSSLWELTV